MAEIHVLEGTYYPARDAVQKNYVFHFPVSASIAIDAAASNPTLASFVSLVPNIEASELAGIQAGCIVERSETMLYNTWEQASDVLAQIRARYANLLTKVDTHYGYQYDHYLDTFKAS